MQWNDELIEFEFTARMAPVGDAEAYGHSLREEEDEDGDGDAMEDDLDGVEKDLEALEQQLMDEEDEEDDSVFDDYE